MLPPFSIPPTMIKPLSLMLACPHYTIIENPQCSFQNNITTTISNCPSDYDGRLCPNCSTNYWYRFLCQSILCPCLHKLIHHYFIFLYLYGKGQDSSEFSTAFVRIIIFHHRILSILASAGVQYRTSLWSRKHSRRRRRSQLHHLRSVLSMIL
jgi:hypothetical protein